ncbi:MAG: hypothetical protein AAF311_05445 [Pseudomonadota bacterium]
MRHVAFKLAVAVSATMALASCMTVMKTTGAVAALPVKATFHTGKTVGKGVIGTGKAAYYIGSVPVKITDAALDASVDILTITTQLAMTGGAVVSVTRTIKAVELNAELEAIRQAGNILSVVIDA